MRSLGLAFEGKNQKIAILSRVKNQIILERLEENGETPLTEKNLYKVTGLTSPEVVRREVSLKVKRQAALLQALPFQLETVLPFPSEEAVVYPFFHPQEEGTQVIVFATRKQTLQNHLQQSPLIPDQISCVPRALFQWARFVFQVEKYISFIYQNTAIALEGDKIVFSQAFEDPRRLADFMRAKFSTYFRVPDPMSEKGPTIQDIPYEKLLEFAVPIGLALEGLEKQSCQFLQTTTSPSWIQKKRSFFRRSLTASLALAGVILAAGFIFLHLKERQLSQRVDAVFSSSQTRLEEKTSQWQTHLLQEIQKLPAQPHHPTVASTLAWIGNMDASIDVVQFHWGLVESSIKIDIDFKAPTLPAAERFKEALEKPPTLIDKKQKIEWTATQDSYRISFFLRKI